MAVTANAVLTCISFVIRDPAQGMASVAGCQRYPSTN
jgi:hypothetical protein